MNNHQQSTYEPDWSYWRQFPQITLKDAVLLSCNIEPRCIENQSETNEALTHLIPINSQVSEEFFGRPMDQLFIERAEVVRANTGHSVTGEPLTFELDIVCLSNPLNSMTLLNYFVTWAVSFDWKLPEPLISISKQQASAASKKKRLMPN